MQFLKQVIWLPSEARGEEAQRATRCLSKNDLFAFLTLSLWCLWQFRVFIHHKEIKINVMYLLDYFIWAFYLANFLNLVFCIRPDHWLPLSLTGAETEMETGSVWGNMGCYYLVFGGTWSVWGGIGWYLVVFGQYWAVLVSSWWYLFSMGRYWLVLGNTWSVWGGTGWYLVVLGQFEAALAGTLLYWVCMRQCWLVLSLSDTGSVKCFYACIYWKCGDLVRCYQCLTDKPTDRQQNIDLLSLYKV